MFFFPPVSKTHALPLLTQSPCSFLHTGEGPMRPMDCKNDFQPGQQITEGLKRFVCPSGAVGGDLMVSKVERDPCERKESLLLLPGEGFQGVNTRVRCLPSSALDSKCNFSSAISSHREGGGLIPNSKLFQYTDFVLFCQRDRLHPPWPIQAEETQQPNN